jgi:hypothetical protein
MGRSAASQVRHGTGCVPAPNSTLLDGDQPSRPIDEYTFRFSRRTSRSRGKLFYRLVQQAVRAPPAPYRKIITA